MGVCVLSLCGERVRVTRAGNRVGRFHKNKWHAGKGACLRFVKERKDRKRIDFCRCSGRSVASFTAKPCFDLSRNRDRNRVAHALYIMTSGLRVTLLQLNLNGPRYSDTYHFLLGGFDCMVLIKSRTSPHSQVYLKRKIEAGHRRRRRGERLLLERIVGSVTGDGPCLWGASTRNSGPPSIHLSSIDGKGRLPVDIPVCTSQHY